MTIQVGDGVTQCVGSDCYPFTVVEVLSPNRIVIQGDNFYRTDNNGQSEMQDYTYSPNPDAGVNS